MARNLNPKKKLLVLSIDHIDIIGSKWVHRKELLADGTSKHYKALLVAQGYNQQAGVDSMKYLVLLLNLLQYGLFLIWHYLIFGSLINSMRKLPFYLGIFIRLFT